ncbi:TPA: hypothetical protein ACQ53L_003246 [Klebsiella pneumoniae]
MTDITELAQLRAELLSPAIGSNAHLRKIALSLVEALEKAQAKADVYDMLRDDYGLREKGVGLADFVDWQANRIAELESRTVKLPPCVDDLHGIGMVMSADAVVEALTSYGIKVEAE